MVRLLVWKGKPREGKQKQKYNLCNCSFGIPVTAVKNQRPRFIVIVQRLQDCWISTMHISGTERQPEFKWTKKDSDSQGMRTFERERARETDFTTFSHRHMEHPQPSAHTIFNQASNGSYGSIVTLHRNNFSFWDRQQSAFLCSSVVGSLLYFSFICKLLWPQMLWVSIWLNRTQRLEKCLWFVAWMRCVRLEMECVCVDSRIGVPAWRGELCF